jgi:hypothetical protein
MAIWRGLTIFWPTIVVSGDLAPVEKSESTRGVNVESAVERRRHIDRMMRRDLQERGLTAGQIARN